MRRSSAQLRKNYVVVPENSELNSSSASLEIKESKALLGVFDNNLEGYSEKLRGIVLS